MQKNLGLYGILIAVALGGLLLFAICNTPAAAPLTTASPPTWGPLPTRIPALTPTPTPLPRASDAPLQTMRLALLQGDLEAAETAWETALALAPASSDVQREGARLALAQRDLDAAATRVWRAIELTPDDAEAWILLGLILQQQGDPKTAQQALGVAEALNPALAPTFFGLRWQTARQAQDAVALQQLAQRYMLEHPDNPLALYYRAEALLVSGDAPGARELLLLSMSGDEAAVFWYTLGRTYMATGAANEAVICFEAARARLAVGDTTLGLATDDPNRETALALAGAYVRATRCADAEALLRPLSVRYPDLEPLVEQAIVCQTPTPTWTPWFPLQTPGPYSTRTQHEAP